MPVSGVMAQASASQMRAQSRAASAPYGFCVARKSTAMSASSSSRLTAKECYRLDLSVSIVCELLLNSGRCGPACVCAPDLSPLCRGAAGESHPPLQADLDSRSLATQRRRERRLWRATETSESWLTSMRAKPRRPSASCTTLADRTRLERYGETRA